MHGFTRILALTSALLSAVTVIAPTALAADAPVTILRQILSDSDLWGDQGLATLAAIGHWKRLGESSISVYADKVVSTSKYRNEADARSAAARLARITKSALPRLRSSSDGAAAKRVQSFIGRFKVAPLRILEDDSYRIGWSGGEGAFLRPNTAMQTVIARYGAPQKTMTEVIHAQGERRPAILTIHEYGDGAIKFVESDHAAQPGTIDRVILDTSAVARELYVSEH